MFVTFRPETRVLVDRGACQTYAEQGIGDATDCWKPVYINLMFTDLNVLWMELLFVAMENNMKDLAACNRKLMEAEKKKKRAALEQQVIIIVPSILLVLADPHIERWLESSSLPYFLVLVLENLAEFSAFLWWFIVHRSSDDLRDSLHEHVHDPIDRTYTNTAKVFSKACTSFTPKKVMLSM